MQWLLLALIVVVCCFGFVLLFGAPYLPTLTAPAQQAIELTGLKPGQTLLELGCGDGKILKLAAAAGLNAVGFEINPILVVVARLHTWSYRKQVRVVWGNFWHEKKWPEADAIFTFALQKYMRKLDNKIAQRYTPPAKPIKLVSFVFPIPGKAAATQTKTGLYVYEYR